MFDEGPSMYNSHSGIMSPLPAAESSDDGVPATSLPQPVAPNSPATIAHSADDVAREYEPLSSAFHNTSPTPEAPPAALSPTLDTIDTTLQRVKQCRINRI